MVKHIMNWSLIKWSEYVLLETADLCKLLALQLGYMYDTIVLQFLLLCGHFLRKVAATQPAAHHNMLCHSYFKGGPEGAQTPLVEK